MTTSAQPQLHHSSNSSAPRPINKRSKSSPLAPARPLGGIFAAVTTTNHLGKRGSPTKTAALAIQLPSPPRSSSTLSLSNQSLHFQSAIFGHCDVSPHSQMPLAPPPSTRSIIMLSETLRPSPPNLLSLSLHPINHEPYASPLTKPFQKI